ncbi:hypothetical protein [Mesorhizobium sp. M0088]|uniref:hypothetical protein n=1 Tax=Mesorhizobium sp. M0088 TaxID=2956873 RepID=UPI003338A587
MSALSSMGLPLELWRWILPCGPGSPRHRFAVTRLGLWHQQRADVQALLPLLATYLGHASYSDTAYYLTGSADLLAIAAERAFLDGGAA